MSHQDNVDRGVDGRVRRAVCDLDINHLVLKPFSKASHTFSELASSLESWISDCNDVNVWQCMADECLEVLRKGLEGILTSLRKVNSRGRALVHETNLEAMNEDEEKCFAHTRQRYQNECASSSVHESIHPSVHDCRNCA